MKTQIPQELADLPDGPHKRDLIRQFVKKERRKRSGK